MISCDKSSGFRSSNRLLETNYFNTLLMSMTSAVISFSTTTTYNDNNKNNNCTGKFPLVSKNICHPLMFTVDTVEHRGTLIDQKISCSLKGNTILGKNMHF